MVNILIVDNKIDFAMSLINLLNKIDYARQYALNPNHGPYHYFGIRGDCTNFTSQILEAAGVAQEVYDSEYMGWWHRKEWTG